MLKRKLHFERSLASLTALFAPFVFLISCQTPPTKVFENPERQVSPSVEPAAIARLIGPIVITEKTVIIDARSSFDFSMAHIPRSVNLQWSDFGEAEESSRGVLQSDRFAIARRLARLGVSPDQHIVVAGDGLSGRGEEGRLAWMLLVLGCKNVQFSSLQALGAKQTNMESPVPRMAPIWKPEENLALEASREEILHVINKSGVYKATRWRADSPERVYRIIDVRSEKAYLGSQMESNIKAVPNIDAINIPWREFFTKNFRPNPGIRSRLEAVGIRPGFRILVISEDGVESGAVTAALLAIGYPDVANVSGGLKQLLARPR